MKSKLVLNFLKAGSKKDKKTTKAVRAQAEDDREQKGTGHQGGRVDRFLETLPDTGTVPSLGYEACGAGWCWAHPEGGLLSSSSDDSSFLWEGSQGLNSQMSRRLTKGAQGRKACAPKNASPETERSEWRQQRDSVIFYKSTRLFSALTQCPGYFPPKAPHRKDIGIFEIH